MADGSIIVDTELDTEGFRAGSKELQSAVKSLNSQVERLGPTLKKGLAGSTAAMSEFNSKSSSLEQTISEIERGMQLLAGARLPTEEYARVCAELEQMSQRFDDLYTKQEKYLATGGNTNSQQWRSIQYDMDMVSDKYHELLRLKQELETGGKAFTFGRDTAQYSALETGLREAKETLQEMTDEANAASGAVAGIAASAKKLPAWLKKAATATKKLITANHAYKNSFSGVLNQIKRIAPALLAAEGVLGILRKAVNAYMESNQQLASTLNSCWAGIGNLLGPIITRIINLIASAVAYFTAFLRLLGFTGGAAVKAIGGAGGAAKKETDKLKHQLASFDDLNILSDTSSDDSGGGGGGGADAALPEKQLPDWAKLMAEQLKAGDWKGAALTLTNKLNELVDNADWEGMGQKFGYYLNGALTFLAAAITNFNWFNLGGKLASMLNQVLYTVDWKNLGVILGGKIYALLSLIAGFMQEFDWYAAANALFDALKGLFTGLDWGNVVSGLFSGLGNALGGLGKFLAEKIKGAWETAVANARERQKETGGWLIHGFLAGIGEALGDMMAWVRNNVVQPFIDGFRAAFGIHSPSTVMKEQGGYVIQGLLLGLTEAWASIGEFFNTAVSGIKRILGDCWSDIRKEAKSSWKKIQTTIGNSWSDIQKNARNANKSIKSDVSSVWSEVKTTISKRMSEAKDAAASAWTNMQRKAASTGSNIKSDVASVWSDVKKNITSRLSEAKSVADGYWDNIKSKASSTGDTISKTVSDHWQSVKSNITTYLSNARDEAASIWDAMKSKVETVGPQIVSSVVSAWSDVKSKISTYLSGARDDAVTIWQNMASRASEIHGGIKSSLAGIWDNIKTTLTQKAGDIASGITAKFDELKQNAFTWGQHICENIATGINNFNYKVKNAAQVLGQKIKDFVGFSEPKEGPLSNFHTYMPDMIDLMVEGIEGNQHRAVQAVAEMTQSISDEIQNGDYGIQPIVNTTRGLSQLKALAASPTYRTPAIAKGELLPYQVTAKLVGENDGVKDAVWASSDALGQTLVRVIMEAATAVITALQQQGRSGTVDSDTMTNLIIDEINRRTRSMGTSPLL